MTPAILYAYLLEMERRKRWEEMNSRSKKRPKDDYAPDSVINRIYPEYWDQPMESYSNSIIDYIPSSPTTPGGKRNPRDLNPFLHIRPKGGYNMPTDPPVSPGEKVPGYMQNYLTPTTGIRG